MPKHNEERVALSYCISWINSRSDSNTGPELWNHGNFKLDMVSESLIKIKEPRPKTYQEALDLSDKMNNNPDFHNQSHKVVIFKNKTGQRPAPKVQSSQDFTPVYLSPGQKAWRERINA